MDHRQHIPNIPLNPAMPANQTPTVPPTQIHGGPPASSPMGGGGGGMMLQNQQQPPQQQHTPMSGMQSSMGPMGGQHNQPPIMAKSAMPGPGGQGNWLFFSSGAALTGFLKYFIALGPGNWLPCF